MVKGSVVVHNPTGLHLRPAGIFCNVANKFSCKVSFQCEETISNAKSVLSVLGACVKTGDEITIICEGADEDSALQAMLEAVESGLGE